MFCYFLSFPWNPIIWGWVRKKFHEKYGKDGELLTKSLFMMKIIYDTCFVIFLFYRNFSELIKKDIMINLSYFWKFVDQSVYLDILSKLKGKLVTFCIFTKSRDVGCREK